MSTAELNLEFLTNKSTFELKLKHQDLWSSDNRMKHVGSLMKMRFLDILYITGSRI